MVERYVKLRIHRIPTRRARPSQEIVHEDPRLSLVVSIVVEHVVKSIDKTYGNDETGLSDDLLEVVCCSPILTDDVFGKSSGR